MGHSILIDTSAMKMVAASKQKNSVKCLSILADIMKLPDNYLIISPTQEWFQRCFTFSQQLNLYSNTTGDRIKRALPETTLYGCVRVAENLKPDERTSDELEKALGRPFIVDRKPAPEKSARKGSSKSTYSRPKEGTITGKVWDICDTQLTSNSGLLPAKEAIVEACVALGINASTAATQYGKWKASK